VAELSGVSLHVLRHSFASTAGDLGYSEPTIAALLGHAVGSVTGRYIHHLDAVLLAAADRVAQNVLSYMTGIEAQVVELRSAVGMGSIR
jgi:integrase